MDDVVAKFFCGKDAKYGPFRVPRGRSLSSERKEVLPGTLYRYDLVHEEDDQPVTLQIYVGVSGQGSLLWEQEVRTLRRVSSLGLKELPEVLMGGHEDADCGFAFVVTRGGGHPLASDNPEADRESIQQMRDDKPETLKQLILLANALAQLQSLGIIHRNLWPGTIEAVGDPESDRPVTYRLVRFEMSRMLENLIYGASGDEQTSVRHLLIKRDKRVLAYYPPERIRFLFSGGEPVSHGESARSDVYSLGVVACEWFFGPLDLQLDDLDLHDHEFHEKVRRRLDDLNERLRRKVRKNDGDILNEKLRDLLLEMLSPHPASRPTAGEVVSRADAQQAAITEQWMATEGGADRPYVVACMPRESVTTLYRWKWIDASPLTADGRKELTDLIETDLKNAKLAYSPQGAIPFFDAGVPEAKKETRYVLIGECGVWFCKKYQPQTPNRVSLGAASEKILLIKYVIPLDSPRGQSFMTTYGHGPDLRHVSGIRAVPSDLPPAEIRLEEDQGAPWTPLLAAVRPKGEMWEADHEFRRAFDWLLDYQTVELNAREYAYRRVGGAGRRAVLQFDEERDRNRILSSPMAVRYAESSRRRPSFCDFFAALANSEDDAAIEVLGVEVTKDGVERRTGQRAQVEYDKTTAVDAIEVNVSELWSGIPEQGWLRPASDGGSRVALSRQVEARGATLENRYLLSMLQDPREQRTRYLPWTPSLDRLLGAGREAVKEMLASGRFYALQGPPGTGKTTVAATAVSQFVLNEPTDRVLVSAQSNYALDNLAKGILSRLDVLDERGGVRDRADVIPLRVMSSAAMDNNRIDPVLEKFELHKLADRRLKGIRKKIERELRDEIDEARRTLLVDWLEVTRQCEPEFADRLRRAANVVFATCSTATERSLTGRGRGNLFDWVIIEEAAKAWPTELAIPLARARRWTLIGDHRQLPAHRRLEVGEFLAHCAGDEYPELDAHARDSDAYLRVFDLFASLFNGGNARARRPVRMLTEQFRMRRPIAELVSRVFYPQPGAEPDDSGLPPGRVTTLAEKHTTSGLRAPSRLVDPAVVWLDTTDDPRCRQSGGWKNEGEAQIVTSLVRAFSPTPAPPGEDKKLTLAVLTPYRQQATIMRNRDTLSKYVFTIHAFQGREADIVVVSLVRDRVREPGRPQRNLGHLTQEQLVNVMVSRARRLLVIVGGFRHFEEAGDFWDPLCRGVEWFGERFDTREDLSR